MEDASKQPWGLIQLFTGNGKGKTTAALGTAIRAAAIGKRVAIVFFDKGGDTHYSERDVLRKIPNVDLFVTGLDRVDAQTGTFRFGVTEADMEEGRRALAIVNKLFQEKKYDLVVLDEINSSTKLGIIAEADVLSLLDRRPETTELILTGRDAPESYKTRADLVTEMTLVKHYFYRGVKARRGLDY